MISNFLKYLVQRDQKKTKPINIFITSTEIKQNNSNFVHSNFWTCWWIQWSQFFMHRIYFISWKKEKARIKFMNFSQKFMGSVFLGGHPVHLKWYKKILNNLYISTDIKFFEIISTSQRVSNFFKQLVHLKWYQIFWNAQNISNDIEFFETPCTLK